MKVNLPSRKTMTRFKINKKILISAAAVVIFLAVLSFAYLDFGISSSENVVDSNAGTYSTGNGTNNVPGNIILFVEKNQMYDEVLSKKISKQLESEGFDVSVISDLYLQADYSYPALFVSVTGGDVSYTPLSAESDIDVTYVYSSTGSSEYFWKFRESDDNVPVVFTSSEHRNVLLIRGSIELSDRTQGLFSARYYERHVADSIAEEVVKNVRSKF